MPYNAFGQGITQDEALRNAYWEAEHPKKAKIGLICLVSLIALIGLSGVIGLIALILFLISAAEPTLTLCGIGIAASLLSVTVMALAWARI